MKLLSNLVILSGALALAHGLIRIPTDKELDSFIRSIPRFPTPPRSLLPSPLPSFHVEHNRTASPFKPLEGCSINRTLSLWDFGTVQTPNYPEHYPSDTSCDWILEGPQGSRVQVVVFDLETQAWAMGYHDYVAFARDGNFGKVDQFAGNANAQTPFVVESTGNKLGVRFRSNENINYRGLKLGYVVRPTETTNDNGYQVSNDDGFCGRSFVLDTMSEGSTQTTTVTTEKATTVTAGFTPAPETKIIGHTAAPKHAYPWMVALLINGYNFCGGTIVDDQHIMTAAHCTDGAEHITIWVGHHDLTASKEEEPERRAINVAVEHIHQHPKYDEDTVTHDISLIRLPEKLTFNDAIKPICLPNREFIDNFFINKSVNVTGWGITGDRWGISPHLQVANVNVINNGQCRPKFGDVTGNVICSTTNPKNSPCRGDNGGPLFVRQTGPKGDYIMQIGIVSSGTKKCERGYPYTYTRVTAFLDFINQITGKKL